MGAASAEVLIDINARDILAAGIAAGVMPQRFLVQLGLANGTADGSIDLIYAASPGAAGADAAGFVAASTITSYDLTGSLKDPFNRSVNFAEVVLIAVRNNRTTALAYLDVGPHATNGFGRLSSSLGFWPADIAADADQGSIVAPGGWLVMYAPAGVPVGAGATDILRVTTSAVVGSTNTWDIFIAGRSS